MNSSHVSVHWATLFVFGALRVAVAVDCGGDVCTSAQFCTFDGIPNVAKGNATLSINDACHLVVNGIGSSGQDGVWQDPLPADSEIMITGIACPNFSASQAGAGLLVQMCAAVPGDVFSTFTVMNTNGDTLRGRADFSPIGATRYTVAILRGGVVVDQFANLPDGEFTVPKGDVKEVCCDIHGNITYAPTEDTPVTVVGGGTVVGDLVRITGINAQVPPKTVQTRIENYFRNTGPIEMTFQIARPLARDVPVASTWLMICSGLLLAALGAAVLTKRNTLPSGV